ncbi:asparagine synthase (glutamine-hydrolyzing) [Emcibacter nanhaiensis]|uniref:asparagine synthase (glutamine-hydrolyzing) n=1 Tax=Emcibacter nanhaiensis TaxID=1505037 RepID=A0A501PF86_9PROT|nr:asparagine synthase (glutamine-hydrolyzing) [Emcibacter nanhaiensis]TPD59090.1 asparagine synthase (glutamine-hydrolyzing) [Emcibacter nanhaiensis]
MCGIAGVFYLDKQRPVDPQILANMAAIQYHRGPDGFGVEVMDGRGAGFSHARLSIIDLNENRARQPFRNADDTLLLAHNGEFYDYQRIRTDLTSRGARFATKSDSEIILHLYPRFGLEETLRRLRGEFAFALYDVREDALHLVRDRFGIKPLYYHASDDGVVFGSEVKVVMAHPEVSRSFNNEGVLHQLMQVMVPGTTAYDGIHQVKPGHVVTFRRQGSSCVVEDRPYWDFEFPEAGYHAGDKSEEQSIETVREGLTEAVRLRLEADVPVGCYLSGGVDSCSIIGLSAAMRQDPVKAFTIGFTDTDYDETPIAREMARATGADQDILRLDGSHLYGHFEKTIWHTERTIYNTLAVAKYLMSRHVRDVGYKVVVTGEGSDELFAGYPSFRQDLFMHGLDDLNESERKKWEAMLGESNALFKGAMLAAEEHNDLYLTDRVGFTPACLQPWLSCEETARTVLNADRRENLAGYKPGQAIAERLDRNMLDGRHPLDRAQYVWSKTMLEGQILTWGGDRVDMANSMEARPAFLDHHLAESATRIPPLHRIKGRREKYVLKEAMKGLLPKTLYEREKFAFMAPPATVNKDKWSAMMELAADFLSEKAVLEAGVLDPSGVQRLITEAQEDTTPRARLVQLDAMINHMLGVQILHRNMIAADIPALAAKRAQDLGWVV